MLNTLQRFTRTISLFGFLVVSFAGINGCGGNTSDSKNTDGSFSAVEIEKARVEKNDHFKNDEDSPLYQSQKEEFTGLQYFPPKEDYYLPATLKIFDNPDTITLATSATNQTRRMIRFGQFTCTLDEKTTFRLTAFKHIDRNESDELPLFIPFKDKTSGFESYGNGRYLDVEESDGDEYTLDFNRAYNPYCAYNARFTCPLVPKENVIGISIFAGEKAFSSAGE